MLNNEDRPNRPWQRYLYAAYGIAAAGFVVAVWRGWFTQKSRFTTDVAPAVILALIFATILVRGPLSVLRSSPISVRRAIVDLLKGLLCLIGSLGWIALIMRRVPDTYAGATVLFVPSLGLGLWGMFYLFRIWRLATGSVLRAVITPRTMPGLNADQIPENLTSVGVTAERIEIPVDYGTVILKFVVSLLINAATWWLLGRNSLLISTISAAGTVYIVYLNGRIVFGHGPGLVITVSGISVRKGLGLVSDLAWSEITTVEIKVTMLYKCLVIGMRDPQRLIGSATGYRRWALQSNLQMFGSPFIVYASSLKCDRQWLLRTVMAYRVRYGAV